MAVVGAKLSEGLNFTDDLARAVIMVGLPYPNASSPELKERLKYVSNLSKQEGKTEDAGKELYENLCMNAVNQSIGTRRSIVEAGYDPSTQVLIPGIGRPRN
jgi:chromosome transmission fidelity protein 1